MSFADEVCGGSIAAGASVLIQGRWSREEEGEGDVGGWVGEPGEEYSVGLNWLSVELVANSAKQQRTHLRDGQTPSNTRPSSSTPALLR
jgi:hypothetical protein